MALAAEQIKAAFDQAQKEIDDLHERVKQGMRESKRNGTQIGLQKGTTLITKKSILCKEIIKKHSRDFGGSLDDPETSSSSAVVREILIINTNERLKRKLDSFGIK